MGVLKTTLNLDAETQASISGAEATPVLTISNASTGPSLKVDRFVATSSATIASLSAAAGTVILDKITVNQAIPAALATVTGMVLRGTSCASGAIISFINRSALVSCSTIAVTTGGVAGTYALRVVLPLGTFGWIPVYPDAAVTASAVE